MAIVFVVHLFDFRSGSGMRAASHPFTLYQVDIDPQPIEAGYNNNLKNIGI